jgi:hypothetical protein
MWKLMTMDVIEKLPHPAGVFSYRGRGVFLRLDMTSVERRRNFMLAALLGTLEVISLLGFVGCLLALTDLQAIPSMTQGTLFLYAVCFGLSAICVYGILDWKRWGVYGLGLLAVALAVVNVLQGAANFQSAVVAAVLVVTFVASLRPSWPHFD